MSLNHHSMSNKATHKIKDRYLPMKEVDTVAFPVTWNPDDLDRLDQANN